MPRTPTCPHAPALVSLVRALASSMNAASSTSPHPNLPTPYLYASLLNVQRPFHASPQMLGYHHTLLLPQHSCNPHVSVWLVLLKKP
ncbi:hypothetical protein K438DRAFT_1000185 [Mycena galopus ATCC 62051]|nr:hypothetical protein K438DRAFT_1000185 [Mycena galopus ATCC 62051]